MRGLAIIRISGSGPDIDLGETPINFVWMAQVQNQGLYLLSGTGPQLNAINDLSQVIGLVAVTEGGDIKWPETDGVISEATRTRINNWITTHLPAQPTIPAGWTYRQLLNAIGRRMNPEFAFNRFDIAD